MSRAWHAAKMPSRITEVVLWRLFRFGRLQRHRFPTFPLVTWSPEKHDCRHSNPAVAEILPATYDES